MQVDIMLCWLQICEFIYVDPMLKETSLPLPSEEVLEKLQNLALEQALDQNSEQCLMLHLQPDKILELFPELLEKNVIKSTSELAKSYFLAHPEQAKFSRKISNLSSTYLKDGTPLAEKKKCRFVWGHTEPNQTIFKNLPNNTSAAFVFVPDAHRAEKDSFDSSDEEDDPFREHHQGSLYYIKNKQDQSPQIIDTDSIDIDQFNRFKFSTQGLTHVQLIA